MEVQILHVSEPGMHLVRVAASIVLMLHHIMSKCKFVSSGTVAIHVPDWLKLALLVLNM